MIRPTGLARLGATPILIILAAWLFTCAPAVATVVRFNTVLGNIDVRLYDTATPASVANFMNYVNDGDWDGSFFHRSVPGFIVQGGGYEISNTTGKIVSIPGDPPVVNEPGLTNIRGTLAYAKLENDPNSATNQWFFNLANNSSNLDNQNGGFTVFGRVLGNGMAVADAIAALPRVNIGAPFHTMPVVNWSTGQNITAANLVYTTTITELTFPEGDSNFDGVVNSVDYTVWRDSVGSTTQAEADHNGDGVVNVADYNLWANAYAGALSTSASASVPEPTSLACLALFASSMAFGFRRANRQQL